jgi:RNA polymerase primary sigma factor
LAAFALTFFLARRAALAVANKPTFESVLEEQEGGGSNRLISEVDLSRLAITREDLEELDFRPPASLLTDPRALNQDAASFDYFPDGSMDDLQSAAEPGTARFTIEDGPFAASNSIYKASVEEMAEMEVRVTPDVEVVTQKKRGPKPKPKGKVVPTRLPARAKAYSRELADGTVSWPMLSKDDEVELAMAIEAGAKARDELHNSGWASLEQRDELAEVIRNGRLAERRFVLSNLRLVASNVRKMTGKFGTKNLPWEDMIQEGDIGLLKAVEKFDYRKGFRFSTYATYWIRQQIRAAILNKAGLIRVPLNKAYDISRIKRAMNDMKSDLNRTPTLDELSEVLGIAPSNIEKNMPYLNRNYASPTSLDEPVSNKNTEARTRGDMISAEVEAEPWSWMESQWQKEEVLRLMQRLSDEERMVVQMRFGLGGDPPATIATISRMLKCKHGKTSTVLKRAMTTMRKAYAEYHGWADLYGGYSMRSYKDPEPPPRFVMGPTQDVDPLSDDESSHDKTEGSAPVGALLAT